MQTGPEQNPYAAPAVPDEPVSNASNAGPVSSEFFPTSIKKLVFLYISTLGTYTIYWFYKHWKLIEPRMEEKIMPFWRAVFFIFFAHSLFGRVETEARKRSLALSWSAGSLAGIFVILTVAQRIVDRISMRSQTVGYVEALSIGLMLSCIWPIIVVQKTANQVNGDPSGALNARFSGWNILIVLLGVVFWTLSLLGLLLPEA